LSGKRLDAKYRVNFFNRVILAALSSAASMRSQSQLASANADRTIFKASCHLAKDAAERAFLAFTRISMTLVITQMTKADFNRFLDVAEFVDFGLQIGKDQDWRPYTNWVAENERRGTWDVIQGGLPGLERTGRPAPPSAPKPAKNP
jgi:hypothetical protein